MLAVEQRWIDRKRGKDREWFFIQTDAIGGPHQGLGASLRLAPALKKREEGRGEKRERKTYVEINFWSRPSP